MKKITIFPFILLFLVNACDLIFPSGNETDKNEFKRLWRHEYLVEGFGPDGGPLAIGDSLVAWIGDLYFNISNVSDGSIYLRTKISDVTSMKADRFYLNAGAIFAPHIDDLWSWEIAAKSLRWKINLRINAILYNSIANDKFYIANGKSIAVLDCSTGELLETVPMSDYPSSAIYGNGKIYCGFFIPDQGIDSGWITCYDAVSFDSLWAFHTDKGGFSAAGMRPTVENGILYASATGGPDSKGLLVALNAETGEVIWEQRDIGPIGSAKEAFIDGDIIYGSANLGPFAVNKNTGDVIWFTNVADQVGCCENMPALLNGILYHVQGNGLFIIDASSGEILEHIYHDSENYWYVSASSNRVFLQTAYAVYCHEPYKR